MHNQRVKSLRKQILQSTLALAALLCFVLALFPHNAISQESPKDHTSPSKEKEKATPPDILEVAKAIDALIEEKWQDKELEPSKPAFDGEWVRRVYLDALGRIPTLTETQMYIEDKDKAKRSKLIQTLLASPEHAQNMGLFWLRALLRVGAGSQRAGLLPLYAWLQEKLVENMPYNQMVYELISARGEVQLEKLFQTKPSPAGYLIAFNNEKANIAGNISRAFLGIQIQCAQCHDHPYEDWSQENFINFSAFFRATYSRRGGLQKSQEDENKRIFSLIDIPDRAQKAKVQKRAKNLLEKDENLNEMQKKRLTLLNAKPQTLDGQSVEAEDGFGLRKGLAQWITRDDNPWFARTLVNRLWGYYLKRGIVEPVDDFSEVNQPSNPELLELLSQDFISSGYDLRRLENIILATRAYGLSSEESSNNSDDRRWYSKGYIISLRPEQLFDSLVVATGLHHNENPKLRRNLAKARLQLLRKATIESSDDEAQDAENFSGTLPQVLEIMNGKLFPEAGKGQLLTAVLRKEKEAQKRVKIFYLVTLGREPTHSELKDFTHYLESENDSREAYEDIFWALLASSEFITNH